MKYGTDRLATRILNPIYLGDSELLVGTLKHLFIGFYESIAIIARAIFAVICRFFAFVALYITSLFTKIGSSV